MATKVKGGASAPSTIVGAHVPLAVALATIPSLPRPLLSRLVARAIERLDELDGDPEAEEMEAEDSFRDYPADGPGCLIGDPAEQDDPPEANGDEQDGNRAEDDFCRWPKGIGPGCIISDPDKAVDDDPCDALTEDGL